MNGKQFSDLFVEWEPEYQIPGTRQVIPARPAGIKRDNLSQLQLFLNKYVLRRRADDVNLTLPRHIGGSNRWVKLNSEQQRHYDALAQIKGGAAHIHRTQAGRTGDGISALIDAFMAELEQNYVNEKVIVYCETVAVVKALSEHLDSYNIGNRCIEGDVSVPDRAKALADFRDDPDVHVLIGSKVLELGLNIQHCRVLISLDCSDNPQREHQREGRIRRIGSPHDSYVHLTLLPDTPTVRKKWKRLSEKQADADLLFGLEP